MKNNILPRRVLNVTEAATATGYGHNRIRELVRSGKIRALPGRNIRIPEHALEEFLQSATREEQ